MYIVAIGWLYVTLMMAVTEKTIVAGVMTFVFYGLAPCSVLLWLMGAPGRGRAKRKTAKLAATQDEVVAAADEQLVDQHAHQTDRANPKSD